MSPHAIATVASRGVLQSYGVVGLAMRQRSGLSALLPPNRRHEGVEVTVADDQIIIELFVVLEYGVRISEVAHNLMSAVKFSVEQMLGMPVVQVNVNVRGLRVSGNEV